MLSEYVISIHRIGDEMNQNKNKANSIISNLMGLEDPVSKSLEERKKIFNFKDFISHDQNELIEAFNKVTSNIPPHGKDLFEFNLEVANQHLDFMYSRLVWEKIGEPNEPVLLNVLLDKTRHFGELRVGTHRISDLRSVLEHEPKHQWSQYYLNVLESFATPCVYILYSDDEMTSKHGFPFDIAAQLLIPDYFDKSNIANLFIKCLAEGYNLLDSYQLLKFTQKELESVLIRMIQSRHFSKKELEFINSLIMIKTLFEQLLESGQLDQGFSKQNKKKYTEIMFQQTDSLIYTMRSFSEHGLHQEDIEKPNDFKFLDELAERTIHSLDNGDHYIRFVNQSYMLEYGQPMWVPILLKGGELSFPKK